MRAALVNSTVLAEKAADLNLGALLRLGKGEERSDGRSKPSILAGAFEALLGAHLSRRRLRGGAQGRRALFSPRMSPANSSASRTTRPGFRKSARCCFTRRQLIESLPRAGPDHEKVFVTEITVGGKVLGKGEGRSKKQSEQEAAKLALVKLQRVGS